MAKFVVSVSKSGDSNVLTNLPDIALVGPSNAGKSSLINAIAKSKIALVSNKPGKTRTLNFYDFDRYYLVDTPGYGYSKGSKSERDNILDILNNYFTGNRSIVGVMQIIASHGLSDKDLEVSNYLISRFHNYSLLINKVDRLSNNQRTNLLNEVIKDSRLNKESIIPISAKNGFNLSVVIQRIREFLG